MMPSSHPVRQRPPAVCLSDPNTLKYRYSCTGFDEWVSRDCAGTPDGWELSACSCGYVSNGDVPGGAICQRSGGPQAHTRGLPALNIGSPMSDSRDGGHRRVPESRGHHQEVWVPPKPAKETEAIFGAFRRYQTRPSGPQRPAATTARGGNHEGYRGFESHVKIY